MTINYSNANGIAGKTAMFTVKPTQYDSTANDSTAILQKDVTLTNNTGNLVINPADIPDTVTPQTYYYDIKVLDTSGAIYQIAQGNFVLSAWPTNRET